MHLIKNVRYYLSQQHVMSYKLMNLSKIEHIRYEINFVNDMDKFLVNEFNDACENGDINVIDYIWNIANDTETMLKIIVYLDYFFGTACKNDCINVCKYLWNKSLILKCPIYIHNYDPNFNCVNSENFVHFIEISNILGFRASITLDTITYLKQTFVEGFARKNENLFIEICKNGYLDIVKYLWKISKGTIDIHIDNEHAFRKAYENGYLDVIKYLWKISKQTINIHIDDERAFRWACFDRHLDIAKYLWKISKHTIDIHIDNERAFRYACENGYLDVIKYLWKISKQTINIHVNNECAFRYACENGHLGVIKYLWKISNHTINIHIYNEYAFRLACCNGHLDIVKYLWKISMTSGNTINFSNFATDLTITNENHELIDFLMSLPISQNYPMYLQLYKYEGFYYTFRSIISKFAKDYIFVIAAICMVCGLTVVSIILH